MDSGVVYVATGEKFIEEAKTSIASLHRHMPDMSVTVFSDRELDCKGVDKIIQLEDPRYDYGDSIIDFDDVPYDRTLFLDTDTIVLDSVSELFESLDRFDFAATHTPGKRYYTAERIPESFPLYNSGVFLFKKNKRVEELFKLWDKFYLETIEKNEMQYNQPSLRKALYYSNVNILTLPREYNTFIIRPGQICGSVKIIHGRHANINDIVEKINEIKGPRCYIPYSSTYPINIEYPGNMNGFKPSYSYKIRHIIAKIRHTYHEDGLLKGIGRIKSKLKRK